MAALCMLLPYRSLQDYAGVRAAILTRITALLADDTRVAAAWLAGSFGRGEADAWSDIDLHIAVADDQVVTFLAERPLLFRRIGAPVLVQEELPANALPGGTFQLVLYPGPVEVDWNIGPLSRAVRQLGNQLLVERALVPVVTPRSLDDATWHQQATHWLTFFWAMAPIAVKYCGRGTLVRAINQIALLSRGFIALWRLLHDANGPEPLMEWTNQATEPEIVAELPQLGPHIDTEETLRVVEALCTAVERFHPVLAERGVIIPTAMPNEVYRLAALARHVLRQGTVPEHPYR